MLDTPMRSAMLPKGRVFAVVVRSGNGFAYACHRESSSGWRCGCCERGLLRRPELGRRCPACDAEVIGVQRGVELWIFGLVVLMLIATWVALVWWR